MIKISKRAEIFWRVFFLCLPIAFMICLEAVNYFSPNLISRLAMAVQSIGLDWFWLNKVNDLTILESTNAFAVDIYSLQMTGVFYAYLISGFLLSLIIDFAHLRDGSVLPIERLVHIISVFIFCIALFYCLQYWFDPSGTLRRLAIVLKPSRIFGSFNSLIIEGFFGLGFVFSLAIFLACVRELIRRIV